MSVKVEFVAVPERGVVGTVLHEREFGLMIDARAYAPQRGDLVALPHPHRKQRVVQQVLNKYRKEGSKQAVTIQVRLIEDPPTRHNGRRRTSTEAKVRQARSARKKVAGGRR